jgi:ribosome-associated translation inhibitor RaiA
MSVPVQITYRHLTASESIDACIRDEADALSSLAGEVRSCHVVVELAHFHPRRFHVRVHLPARHGEVDVTHTPPAGVEEDAGACVRAAFDVARRQLQSQSDRQRAG